jgi:phytoene desaturase
MGGTGALIRGAGQPDRGPGRASVRLQRRGEADPVERGRATGVLLEGGERIAADVVVSNADSAWTYRHLLAPEHRKRWTDAQDRARRFR